MTSICDEVYKRLISVMPAGRKNAFSGQFRCADQAANLAYRQPQALNRFLQSGLTEADEWLGVFADEQQCLRPRLVKMIKELLTILKDHGNKLFDTSLWRAHVSDVSSALFDRDSIACQTQYCSALVHMARLRNWLLFDEHELPNFRDQLQREIAAVVYSASASMCAAANLLPDSGDWKQKLEEMQMQSCDKLRALAEYVAPATSSYQDSYDRSLPHSFDDLAQFFLLYLSGE